ncbi:MAG: hypothetical protein ACXWL5_03905 [Candidatus Chromulinivorax sp.]
MQTTVYANHFEKSLYEACYDMVYTTGAIVGAAAVIGASSYVIDLVVLRNFQATSDLENRGNIATGISLFCYLTCLGLAEYTYYCDEQKYALHNNIYDQDDFNDDIDEDDED